MAVFRITVSLVESAISVSCIVGAIVEAIRRKSQKAGAGVLVAAAIGVERTCTNCGVGFTVGIILEGSSYRAQCYTCHLSDEGGR